MIIRQANAKDREAILEIYRIARDFMAKNGNPTQWGTFWPPEDLVDEDLRLGRNYVAEEEKEVVGVFVCLFGEDIEPGYRTIDGAWKAAGPYAVIHRIAVKRHGEGIAPFILEETFRKYGHVRIDTHADNHPMRAVLEKLGYAYCGQITVRDGSLRRAYEKF